MADINGILKTIAEGAVGEIPAVGGLISGMVSLLWPDTPVDYWEEVKEQVYAAIETAINEYKVQELRDLLEGTKDNCEEYDKTEDMEEKRSRCVALDVVFTQLHERFTDDSVESVVYFAQMAALHIAIKSDVLLFYPGDQNKESLKNLIDDYSTYAHKMMPILVCGPVTIRKNSIDKEVCLDILDPLVVRHNTKETTGSGWNTRVTVTSYGVAVDHCINKEMVFSAFMETITQAMSPPQNKEIPGGKEKCRGQLEDYTATTVADTEKEHNAYWQENLIDPIDTYKNAKILQ